MTGAELLRGWLKQDFWISQGYSRPAIFEFQAIAWPEPGRGTRQGIRISGAATPDVYRLSWDIRVEYLASLLDRGYSLKQALAIADVTRLV